MHGPSLTTDAFVLHSWPPSDTFQSYTVFAPREGLLRILQRVPKKNSSAQLAIDLFDEVSLVLEGSRSGDAWFIKEARLLNRHAGIGRRYDSLLHASTLATLVTRNPGPADSHDAIYLLLRTAFNAFATSNRPDIVYLKSLYCFARDEGHPLKQHWIPTLSDTDRPLATTLIHQPLADQITAPAEVARLLAALESYLRQYTEIHFT